MKLKRATFLLAVGDALLNSPTYGILMGLAKAGMGFLDSLAKSS